jgi:hypothetical protein
VATLPDVTALRQAPQYRTQIVGSRPSGIPQAIQGLAGAVGEVVDQAQKEQDAQAVFAARRQLDEWERKALLDPEAGAVNKRGAEAFDLPTRLPEEFDKTAGEVAKGLGTERQRRAFRELADSRRGQITSWADRHTQKERESYDAGQYEADVKSFNERASLFPDQAPVEAKTMAARTIGFMRAKGRSEEEIAQAVRDNTSGLHTSVIAGLVAGGNATQAQEYLTKNSAGMRAQDIQRVQLSLKEGVARQTAQAFTDDVMGQGLPQSQALELARNKFGAADATVREAAVNAVKTRYAERDMAKKEAENASYEAARFHVEQGKQVPMNVWTSMDDGHRADILAAQRGRADALEAKARGKEIKTDWPTYLRVRDFAASNPEEFLADDLGKYAGHIGGPQLEQLQDLKDRMRDPAKQKQVVALEKQVTAAVSELKLTGKANDEKRGQLQSAIYDALDEAQTIKKRPLDYKERQAEIDKLLIKGEVLTGHWWQADPNVTMYQIAGDATKRAKFAPAISDSDRAALVKRFNDRGVAKPTDEQIVNAFKAWKKL